MFADDKTLSHPAITDPNGRAPVLYDPPDQNKGVRHGLSQSECRIVMLFMVCV